VPFIPVLIFPVIACQDGDALIDILLVKDIHHALLDGVNEPSRELQSYCPGSLILPESQHGWENNKTDTDQACARGLLSAYLLVEKSAGTRLDWTTLHASILTDGVRWIHLDLQDPPCGSSFTMAG
jgi:hypothetical protein